MVCVNGVYGHIQNLGDFLAVGNSHTYQRQYPQVCIQLFFPRLREHILRLHYPVDLIDEIREDPEEGCVEISQQFVEFVIGE